ncbi:Protein of unknown function [Gryllus bimaculatus]|nr:Protein of unknown function [Gryllus bimaculatus]
MRISDMKKNKREKEGSKKEISMEKAVVREPWIPKQVAAGKKQKIFGFALLGDVRGCGVVGGRTLHH